MHFFWRPCAQLLIVYFKILHACDVKQYLNMHKKIHGWKQLVRPDSFWKSKINVFATRFSFKIAFTDELLAIRLILK